MKREFLSKFLHPKAWQGDFGSKELLDAFSSLLDFLHRTRKLGEEFPCLSSEVTIDNRNLEVQRILPFSAKLYEQIISAAVEGDHQAKAELPIEEVVQLKNKIKITEDSVRISESKLSEVKCELEP